MPFLLAAVAWVAIPLWGPRVALGKEGVSTWRMIAGVAAFFLILTGIRGQFEKARRGRLIAQSKSLEALQMLTWREFEDLCAEAYRRQGYRVQPTARGADGGVDLVLLKGRQRTFVQCKRFAVRRVDVRPIRELFGVMAAEGATNGVFICSGSYTAAATQFARGKRLELIDGPALLKLLEPVTSGSHRPSSSKAR